MMSDMATEREPGVRWTRVRRFQMTIATPLAAHNLGSKKHHTERLPQYKWPAARRVTETTWHVKIVCYLRNPPTRFRPNRNRLIAEIIFIKRRGNGREIEHNQR